jgi:hypothetical protein
VPTIKINYGEPGSGKTFDGMTNKEPIAVIDLERKAQLCADDFFDEKLIRVFDCWSVKKGKPKGNKTRWIDDPQSTMEYVLDAVGAICNNMQPLYDDPKKSNRKITGYEPLTNNKGSLVEYETIILDGAQKLLRFARELWMSEKGVDWVFGFEAFGYVNEKLTDIFDPIVTLGKFFGKNVIICAGRKGDYQPTGEYDKSGNMKTEKTGFMPNIKEFVGHAVDMICFFRVMDTPAGKQRVSSFDKHAKVGDIDMNLGFVDMTSKKLALIHHVLKKNRKEAKKASHNSRYNPKIIALETIFENTNESFHLSKVKNMKICIHCGAFINKEFKACPRCGKAQKREDVEEQPEKPE